MKKQIAQEIIDLLNSGQRETTNLMESLVVDHKLLCSNVLPDFTYPEEANSFGIVKKLRKISFELNNQFGFEVFERINKHKSDVIRSMACLLVEYQNIEFRDKIDLLIPLADDPNSGVREWAWMAVREDFAKDLENNIKLLSKYTNNNSDNIRRFVSELTRPRGVWCSHIMQLKKTPWLALDLIEPLKSDNARYVQLSVGNWLNDAGKDHPQWVRELCDNWLKSSNTIETNKICKRALRNLSVIPTSMQ